MSTTTGPLVITSDTSNTMELTEINSGGTVGYDAAEKVAKVLLDYFAQITYNSPVYTSGAIVVNPASTTGLTFIGSFTDTKRGDAVGVHPVGTGVSSVTYNFYQDRAANLDFGSGAPDPVYLNNGDIMESDYHSPVDDAVVDAVLDIYVGNVASDVQNGNYVLQPSAPATGTWTSQFVLSNTKVDGSSNTTTLWRKTTAAGLPSGNRKPLKIENNTTDSIDLKEFSDNDILDRYKALMMNTMNSGKGQYELAASAPTSGGTWVAAGSAFNDTRYALGSIGYSGSRTYQLYSQAFYNVTTFTPGSFSNTFSGSYAGTTVVPGSFSGFTPAPFTGAPTPANFSGTRIVPANYSGSRVHSFSGTRVSYSTRQQSFLGHVTYAGTYVGKTVLSSIETNETKTLWIRVG